MKAVDFSLPWPDTVHPEQFPGTIARDSALVGHRHADLDKPFTYCAFGCGRGATLLVLAASFSDAKFYGIDGDADRIAHAQSEAEAIGLGNVTFIHGGFDAVEAIPPCNFMSAHGVLSWMPPGSDGALFAAANTLLKPDGLLHLHATLSPGWTQMDSLRRIAMRAAEGAHGDAETRAREALETVRTLCTSEEPFVRTNPLACKLVERWCGKELSHVARDMLGPHALSFNIGDLMDLATTHGLEVCGPLHHNKPHGRAFCDALFPNGKAPSGREDFISHAKAELHRSLVFRKPGPDAQELGTLILTGADVVGFTEPTRWSSITGFDFSSLHEELKVLDEFPLWLGSITAHSLIDDSLRDNLEDMRELVGAALMRRRAVIYARMTEDFEGDGPVKASHSLTTRLLETPRTYRYGTHLPSPVLGGGVSVPPAIAALLRAQIEGAKDLSGRATQLIANMDSKAPPWALEDPDRNLPDVAAIHEAFTSEWLPFLGRLSVIERS